MELDTYFNMDYFHQTQQLYDEVTPPPPLPFAPEPEQHLIAYDPHAEPEQQHLLAYDPHESFFFFPNATFDQSYFDQTGFIYPTEIYPKFLASNDIIFQHEEDFNLPFPKRQKCFHHDNFEPNNFFDSFVPNPSFKLPSLEELACVEAQQFATKQGDQFNVPQLSSKTSNVGDDCYKSNEKISFSPQSLAARERRRKITDKTQELGKLVPGGTKMNTAEMLNAAGKYVRYLQAQVEMLELMRTIQAEEATPSIDENLQALLLFPSVQEKMYSEEKCFVAKDFVTTLINHDNLRPSPSILKDLTKLIGTDIKKKAKQE